MNEQTIPNLVVWGNATKEECGVDYAFSVSAPAKLLADVFNPNQWPVDGNGSPL